MFFDDDECASLIMEAQLDWGGPTKKKKKNVNEKPSDDEMIMHMIISHILACERPYL